MASPELSKRTVEESLQINSPRLRTYVKCLNNLRCLQRKLKKDVVILKDLLNDATQTSGKEIYSGTMQHLQTFVGDKKKKYEAGIAKFLRRVKNVLADVEQDDLAKINDITSTGADVEKLQNAALEAEKMMKEFNKKCDIALALKNLESKNNESTSDELNQDVDAIRSAPPTPGRNLDIDRYSPFHVDTTNPEEDEYTYEFMDGPPPTPDIRSAGVANTCKESELDEDTLLLHDEDESFPLDKSKDEIESHRKVASPQHTLPESVQNNTHWCMPRLDDSSCDGASRRVPNTVAPPKASSNPPPAVATRERSVDPRDRPVATLRAPVDTQPPANQQQRSRAQILNDAYFNESSRYVPSFEVNPKRDPAFRTTRLTSPPSRGRRRAPAKDRIVSTRDHPVSSTKHQAAGKKKDTTTTQIPLSVENPKVVETHYGGQRGAHPQDRAMTRCPQLRPALRSLLNKLVDPNARDLLFVHARNEDNKCLGFAAATSNFYVEGRGLPFDLRRGVAGLSRDCVNPDDLVRFYLNNTEAPPIIVCCDYESVRPLLLLDECPYQRPRCGICENTCRRVMYILKHRRLPLCKYHAKMIFYDKEQLGDDTVLLYQPELVYLHCNQKYVRCNIRNWEQESYIEISAFEHGLSHKGFGAMGRVERLCRAADSAATRENTNNPMTVVRTMQNICQMFQYSNNFTSYVQETSTRHKDVSSHIDQTTSRRGGGWFKDRPTPYWSRRQSPIKL